MESSDIAWHQLIDASEHKNSSYYVPGFYSLLSSIAARSGYADILSSPSFKLQQYTWSSNRYNPTLRLIYSTERKFLIATSNDLEDKDVLQEIFCGFEALEPQLKLFTTADAKRQIVLDQIVRLQNSFASESARSVPQNPSLANPVDVVQAPVPTPAAVPATATSAPDRTSAPPSVASAVSVPVPATVTTAADKTAAPRHENAMDKVKADIEESSTALAVVSTAQKATEALPVAESALVREWALLKIHSLVTHENSAENLWITKQQLSALHLSWVDSFALPSLLKHLAVLTLQYLHSPDATVEALESVRSRLDVNDAMELLMMPVLDDRIKMLTESLKFGITSKWLEVLSQCGYKDEELKDPSVLREIADLIRSRVPNRAPSSGTVQAQSSRVTVESEKLAATVTLPPPPPPPPKPRPVVTRKDTDKSQAEQDREKRKKEQEEKRRKDAQSDVYTALRKKLEDIRNAQLGKQAASANEGHDAWHA